jgi:hypothetical protein
VLTLLGTGLRFGELARLRCRRVHLEEVPPVLHVVDGGSRIGARYRHTTDAMAVRVVEAMEVRLTTVLRVAEEVIASDPNRKFISILWWHGFLTLERLGRPKQAASA